jgi:superoxide dismutase, Fe-Mn family
VGQTAPTLDLDRPSALKGLAEITLARKDHAMTFTLPDLPYAHDALAAQGMSKETFEYHHDIHHKAYVDNGNKLIAGTEWEGKSVEDIVRGTYQAGSVAQNGIFNNASQHWNHAQFWEMMGPKGRAMPGGLEKAITESFGSVAKFKEDFAAADADQFGSSWAWLVKDKDSSLKVTKTENGVNPLCFGQTALLGCDVWEHSYYIDFRNKRPAYLTNFLDNLVNWENVASRM